MRSTVLALVGVVGSLAIAPQAAVAAPHVYFSCPAEARSSVSHNGDAGWIATNQSSRLIGMRLETIGTERALVCTYAMFGTEYWIYRRPQAGFANCRVDESRRGFDCVP